MDRLHILGTLLERERKRRDQALQECRELERQAQAAQGQVQTLQSYRVEYQQRWSGQFRQAAPIEILRCYHGFVARLDHAINAQQGAAQQAETRWQAGRERLRQRELKLATVQRLIERRQHLLRQAADRREQKQSDEAAQRKAWAARRDLATL